MVLARGSASEETEPTQPLVCVCSRLSAIWRIAAKFGKEEKKGKKIKKGGGSGGGLYRFHENRLLKRGEGADKCLD